MSGGTHYTFRISDAEIEQKLAEMPSRSDFIRRAILEKLRSTGGVASVQLTEPSPCAPERTSDPIQPGQAESERLRAGLMAIAHGTEAILDASGEDVPELVRVGLIGISETAAILAAEEPGGGEKGHPQVVASVPRSGAKTSTTGTTASHQSGLPLSPAPDTAPRQSATSNQEEPQ